MGWRTVGGRRYYYRSQRDGSRVRSHYVGGGRLAEISSKLDELRKERRTTMRDLERVRRRVRECEDREFDEWFEDVQFLSGVFLGALGYHEHRGQWRRRRP